MRDNPERKIKIVRIFSRLNVGGPSIHTILLTALLNNDRFESVLVKGSEDKDESDMMYLAESKGVKPVVIPEMGRNISLLKDLKGFFKLYAFIKKEKPDIVHTHTAKAGVLGRMAVILLKFNKTVNSFIVRCFLLREQEEKQSGSDIGLVHTFHGHVFQGYFNPIVSRFFLLIEKILASFTDVIITVSRAQRREILELGIGNEKKVISIPLGLELDRFIKMNDQKGEVRKELGINDDTKLVAVVGRLVPIKNHKMFVEAVHRIKERKKLHTKVRFLIIGDGEERGNIEKYVEKLNLERDISFLGFQRDMEKIYADLDLVVLTSLNEGLPVVLIEAMASAKAVIATNVGGVIDLLGDGEETKESLKEKSRISSHFISKCGILIKSDDHENLALAIEELLENDDLRNKMGQEGRKRVYAQYDISRLIKDMKELYQEMVFQSVEGV